MAMPIRWALLITGHRVKLREVIGRQLWRSDAAERA
jgi:hypothetical protein